MAQMIEWKHEKNVVDYRIAEEAMSKRVEYNFKPQDRAYLF